MNAMGRRARSGSVDNIGTEKPEDDPICGPSAMCGLSGLPLLGGRRSSLSSQERWVCPNDRQLALRAKLSMGWSTGQVTPPRQETLSDAETKTIMDVIKKAEDLDLNEQQRIGRLVQKVEKMKSKRLGNGTSTCVLCGGNLPILRTSSLVCADCSKGVCSKCGVEVHVSGRDTIWLCKICSETREMWKRSGAWFFRGIPKYISPSTSSTASGNGVGKRGKGAAPPRRWNSTASKGLPLDDTDTSSEEEMQRKIRMQKIGSASPEPVHISISTRNSKPPGFPPITPDPSPFPMSPRSRSVSPSPLRIDLPGSKSDDQSGGEEKIFDRSPNSPALSPRDFHRTSSRESGGGGDGGGLLTPRYTPSPSSLSPRNELRRDPAFDRSPSPLLKVAWRDSGRSSNSSVSDSSLSCSREDAETSQPTSAQPSSTPVKGGTQTSSSSSFKGVTQTSSPSIKGTIHTSSSGSLKGATQLSTTSSFKGSSQTSSTLFKGTIQPPPTPHSASFALVAPPTCSPSHISQSPAPTLTADHVPAGNSSPIINGFRSRRGSEASRSSSEDRRNPRMNNTYVTQQDSRESHESHDSLLSRDSTRDEMNNGSSSLDEVFQDSTSESGVGSDRKHESHLGLLEFSLLYDSHNQALHCTIHSAKNLKPPDGTNAVDPYVKLHLLPGASKSNKLRTHTSTKTLNPEFNQTLTYYGISDEDMAKKTLRLMVLDEERFKPDVLGEVRLPLKSLIPHETRRLKAKLERKASFAEDETKEVELGRILISLKYSSQRCSLVVGVVRCAHLPSMDTNGFSDPYVKVQLKQAKIVQKKFKTTVKWKNLNPEFNEEFAFEMKRNELAKKSLEIRVYDKDVGRSDDFIGGVSFSQESGGSAIRHWYDVINYPDRRHDRWHVLQKINNK